VLVKAIEASATEDQLLYQRTHILSMNHCREGDDWEGRFGNHSSEVHSVKLSTSLKSSPASSMQQNLQTQEIL